MIQLKVLLLALVSLVYCSYSYSQELISVIVVPSQPDPDNPSGPPLPPFTYVVINDCGIAGTCEPSESTYSDNDNNGPTSTDNTVTLSGSTVYRTDIGVNDLPVKDRPSEEIVVGPMGNDQRELIAKINNNVSIESYTVQTLEQVQMKQEELYKAQVLRQPIRGLRNGLAQQLLHEQLVDLQYKE